ncbi:MAG: hypothetical protein M9910_09870 [Kiritimatiellae bacterium]|nr:hypothetical protein [Kiritimatiellia bacterium]
MAPKAKTNAAEIAATEPELFSDILFILHAKNVLIHQNMRHPQPKPLERSTVKRFSKYHTREIFAEIFSPLSRSLSPIAT